MNNELNPPGFNPEEQEWYHTEDVYDENDDYWYDEQLDWDEHREMSFDRHLENF